MAELKAQNERMRQVIIEQQDEVGVTFYRLSIFSYHVVSVDC